MITKVYKRNMLVSNASTLILLAKVGLLRTFLNEFGEITIPEEVEKEITGGNTFDSKLLKKEIEDKHIIVKGCGTKLASTLHCVRL
jgi:predicted nucleic acid-binding protein